ncbi:hypothetical protein GCM10023238_12780 [Streptomyces heliomycini]
MLCPDSGGRAWRRALWAQMCLVRSAEHLAQPLTGADSGESADEERLTAAISTSACATPW